MKKIAFILFTIITTTILSQNNQKIISGHIYLDSIPVQDVHIINKKLDIGTVSNENGKFEILASKNDILIISHLNIEFKEQTITDKNISTKKINIFLDSKNYMLDEVVLERKKGIFEIDKDILPHNGPIVNAKTLKLPYANSKKPDKDNTVEIESGLSVSVVGLINALNGKTKQKKLLRKLKAEDKNIKKIRQYFTDGFFVQQLKIKRESINPFIEHCISKGIMNLFYKEKLLELTSVLIDNSKNSPYLIEKENTRVTQK